MSRLWDWIIPTHALHWARIDGVTSDDPGLTPGDFSFRWVQQFGYDTDRLGRMLGYWQ